MRERDFHSNTFFFSPVWDIFPKEDEFTAFTEKFSPSLKMELCVPILEAGKSQRNS